MPCSLLALDDAIDILCLVHSIFRERMFENSINVRLRSNEKYANCHSPTYHLNLNSVQEKKSMLTCPT